MRREHWERYWQKFHYDSVVRATHWVTAQTACFLISDIYKGKLPERLQVLDLGCGDGHLTRLLKERLQRLGCFVELVGCDLSSGALQNAKNLAPNINFAQADARYLPFKDSQFDGVVSFGYASVASYYEPSIQKELYRILKSGGWLVSDFRNHLSLYFVLICPRQVTRCFLRYLGYGKVSYHFCTLGLAGYFSQFGFLLQGQRFCLCYPPMRRLSFKLLITIEDIFSRLRLSALMGRIIIAWFQKE